MKVETFTGARLFDLLRVCHRLPGDEKEQWEIFSGEKFDAEKVSAIYSLMDCPKWVIVAENEPIVVGGFTQIRPGVWQDWMFSTPEAWTLHWRPVTRIARRVMDGMLRTEAHRLQCVSLASRHQAHKWYRPLGYEAEGTLLGYGVHGEHAIMFSRLRSL